MADDDVPMKWGALDDAVDPAPGRKKRTWDRILTIGLLVISAAIVLWEVGIYSQYDQVLVLQFQDQGIGEFTNLAAASTAGFWINVVRGVLLFLAIAVSVTFLRARRLAFWVPLVGLAIGYAVTAIIIYNVLMGDPEYVAWLDET